MRRPWRVCSGSSTGSPPRYAYAALVGEEQRLAPDPVSRAHFPAARQAGERGRQGPLRIGQVLHRRDRARGSSRPRPYLEFTAMSQRALLSTTRAVRASHPRHLRGGRAARRRRGRHDRLLRALAAVRGPHRVPRDRPRQGRRLHHQDDRQRRPDQPDLHHHQDEVHAENETRDPVADHRRQPRADRPSARRARRRDHGGTDLERVARTCRRWLAPPSTG